MIDFVLHFDKHLIEFVHTYGTWVYGILFAIVFCETGLVVTPFLPGDSLLFVAGTLAAAGDMYVHGLFAALAERLRLPPRRNPGAQAHGRSLGSNQRRAPGRGRRMMANVFILPRLRPAGVP